MDYPSEIAVKLNVDPADLRARHRGSRMVFCSGCFDILHSGHAIFFHQCRALGDLLVVGVGRDITIRRLKGEARPLNPEANRLFLVASLATVDYAILTDDYSEGTDISRILEQLRPDVLALCDDDTFAIDNERDRCSRLGIEMALLPRELPEELIPTSTTKIVARAQGAAVKTGVRQ